MQSDKVVVKALLFGIAWPLLFIPLSHRLPPSWAAVIVGVVSTLLFHWLPPRIHVGLTVAKSLALSAASGLTAGVAVFAVERLL